MANDYVGSEFAPLLSSASIPSWVKNLEYIKKWKAHPENNYVGSEFAPPLNQEDMYKWANGQDYVNRKKEYPENDWIFSQTPTTQPVKTYTPPTEEEKAAWARAQADFSKAQAEEQNKPTLVETIEKFLPFTFKNPIPQMQQAYTQAGGGMAGIEAVLLDRFKAGMEGAKNSFELAGTSEPAKTTPTPPPEQKPQPQPQPRTPTAALQARNVITGSLPSTTTPAGEVLVSKGSRPGNGMETRRYTVEGVQGSASGIAPLGRSGGFVGSATDAEAARNLQARMQQDQAAQINIASMNRAAEAERDLRAARLGVSRGVLDRMEGRNNTEAAMDSAAAQSATSGPANPISMPGDSLYDTRSRQAAYDRAVQQTLTGNKEEQQGAAATLTALNELRDKNLAAQVTRGKNQTGIDPVDTYKFLLDQQKFNQEQQNDANKFLLDKEKFKYQQGLDKERLTIDKNMAEGKQAEQQLARQKYTDEARKAFVDEFTFPDPKAPSKQIGGAVFDISQATGVPLDVVSQFYEQAVKDLKIDYAKGGPKDPMELNKLVATRITQAYRG